MIAAKECNEHSWRGSEKAVSTLLYLPQKEKPEEEQSALKSALQGQFTPLSSFSFMAFVLLYMPCVVVGAAMQQEFGTWKWVGVATAIVGGIATGNNSIPG
nr:nucleoside recognition domain-containing protein [Trichlorobacter lovleyi]